MLRRDLLRLLGGVSALAAIPTEDLFALGESTHAELRANAAGLGFFDAHQLQTVASAADRIIPTTETPGAREADCHRFAEKIIADHYDTTRQKRFITGLVDLDSRSSATGAETLRRPHAPAAGHGARRGREGDAGLRAPAASFWRDLKYLTIYGYYTSRIGIQDELEVNFYPGPLRRLRPARGEVMRRETFDAIVIGSGIAGGWAAKELSEKGLSVLVLEAGRTIDPARDYLMNAPAFEMDYRYLGDIEAAQRASGGAAEVLRLRRGRGAVLRGRHRQSLHHAGREAASTGSAAGNSVASRSCGAASAIAGATSTSRPTLKDGHGTDWPIRYRDIASWYDYVEGYAGISGEKLGLAHLPDGPFLPPMEMTCSERSSKRRPRRRRIGKARVLTVGRVANLSAGAQRPRRRATTAAIVIAAAPRRRTSTRCRPRWWTRSPPAAAASVPSRWCSRWPGTTPRGRSPACG